MWMMTQHAFTSTVFKEVEDGWYMMRFRDQESADKVCELAGIDPERVYADLPSDYPLRLKISEDEMIAYFRAELRAVTYRNFKDQAKKTKGAAYANALMKVWTSMLALTPPGLKKVNYDAWDKWDREHKTGKYRPKADTTVRYSSGRHPSASASASSADTDEAPEHAYADPGWWYSNFPPLDSYGHMDTDSDFTDLEEDEEVDDLVDDIDAWLDGRSIHDLTEDEWLEYLNRTEGLYD